MHLVGPFAWPLAETGHVWTNFVGPILDPIILCALAGTALWCLGSYFTRNRLQRSSYRRSYSRWK